MNIFVKFLSFFFFFVFCEAKTIKDVQKILPKLEEYTEKSLKEWVAPGCAVAIVKDGKIIYAKGFGVQKHGSEDPIDENTVFQVASLSKTFLVAMIGKLVDDGVLNWDDKVTKYMPELILSDDDILQDLTILDLVTHRSGLKPFSGDSFWNLGFSQGELIRALRHIPITKKFREEYTYQNHMFSIASHVVEHVTGESIADLFRKHFFKTLSMKTASVGIDRIKRKFWQIFWKNNVASPHDVRDGKIYTKPLTDEMYLFPGCSGVNASVRDMAKWLIFQMNGMKNAGEEIIKSETVDFMRTPKVSVIPRENDMQFPASRFFDISYTAGWFRQKYGTSQNNIEFYSHMGAFNGMRSYVLFSPKEKLGVVILSNFGSMRVSLLPEGIRSYFLDLYLGLKPKDWTQEIYTINADIRKKNRNYKHMQRMQFPRAKNKDSYYVGFYENDAYGKIEVSRDPIGLFFKYRSRTVRLNHWNDNSFEVKGYELSQTYSDYDDSLAVFTPGSRHAESLLIQGLNEGKSSLFRFCGA